MGTTQQYHVFNEMY